MWISMLLSWSFSPDLCLPPPVHSVHISMELFLWLITVNATLRGINEMLSVGWVLHQLSHTFDDILTPVFDRALLIVNPSHILESVKFQLPKSLIIWHACHKLLDAIPVSVAWESQSVVFCFQHIVIVCLQACLFNPTLHIFVLFTSRKRVVGIGLFICPKAMQTVAFPWFSNDLN